MLPHNSLLKQNLKHNVLPNHTVCMWKWSCLIYSWSQSCLVMATFLQLLVWKLLKHLDLLIFPLWKVWTPYFQAVVLNYYLSIVIFLFTRPFLIFFFICSEESVSVLVNLYLMIYTSSCFTGTELYCSPISRSSMRESQKSTWISQCIYCLSNYTWQDTYKEWIWLVLFCYYNEMEVDQVLLLGLI